LDFCVCVGAIEPLAEHAPKIAEYGFRCLEITWQRFPHWDLAGCRRLRDGLGDAGLWIRSVHAPFGNELNILDTDPLARLHAVEAHRSVLRGGAELGARLMVMHPGREYQSERPLGEIVAVCVEVVAEVTSLAAELGMEVALENVLPAHAIHDHAVIREIVDTVGHPALGICLDTGHANVVDSVHQAVKAFAGRINHVHLHDNDGKADEHLVPPFGSIDWTRFYRELSATGYEGPLTLECHPPEDMPPADLLPTVQRALGLAPQAGA
jgi:sugar phosphate isomerase/epimerase